MLSTHRHSHMVTDFLHIWLVCIIDGNIINRTSPPLCTTFWFHTVRSLHLRILLKTDKIWSIMPLFSGLNVEVHIKTPLGSSESGRTRICAYLLYEPQYYPASSPIWKMTWRTFPSRNQHAQVHPPETMERIVQVPIDPCRREEEVSDRSQSMQVSVSSFHPSFSFAFHPLKITVSSWLDMMSLI